MKENASQQELELLQRIMQDDEQALGLLMRKYYSDLYNYAARFTQDEALIKDCIQEVFISLWQRRQTIGIILSPKFYFLRAIKNKVLKSLDKAQRKFGLQVLPEDYDFTHEFSVEKMIIAKQVTEENAVRLNGLLAQLSKREKEVIYLKYYQYLDNGQVAELMNISRQSVYNLLHEAIRKLKELWHKEFVTH
ncbi:MAG TPA: sigma-70 family RNA polymerase sigma factor [Chitinophagaceae bacterium]|nr:sigma-70 family RNA polymerase sigma factor [Chitinophagaceae bacterium]